MLKIWGFFLFNYGNKVFFYLFIKVWDFKIFKTKFVNLIGCTFNSRIYLKVYYVTFFVLFKINKILLKLIIKW